MLPTQWQYPTIGDTPDTFDLYIEGTPYVSNSLDSFYMDYPISCGDTVHWFVVARNGCGADTSAEWTFYGERCCAPIATTILCP